MIDDDTPQGPMQTDRQTDRQTDGHTEEAILTAGRWTSQKARS